MAITRIEFLKELRDYRISQYRPAVFREVFSQGGMIVPVNDIVDVIEMYEVTPYGEIKILAQNTVDGLPVTSFDGAGSQAIVLTGGLAFQFSNQFLDKCDANRINWKQVAGKANFQIVEQYLDRTAFLGDTVHGLPGFAKNANVAAYVLSTKAATGVAWAAATHDEIVGDLLGLSDAVFSGSHGYFTADTWLLPTAAYDRAATVAHSTTQKTALNSALERRPNIKRVIKVAHLTTASGTSGTRAICFCSTAEVATFGERPFRDHPIYPLPLGGLVPETFRTTGTLIESVQGMVYADGL